MIMLYDVQRDELLGLAGGEPTDALRAEIVRQAEDVAVRATFKDQRIAVRRRFTSIITEWRTT